MSTVHDELTESARVLHELADQAVEDVTALHAQMTANPGQGEIKQMAGRLSAVRDSLEEIRREINVIDPDVEDSGIGHGGKAGSLSVAKDWERDRVSGRTQQEWYDAEHANAPAPPSSGYVRPDNHPTNESEVNPQPNLSTETQAGPHTGQQGPSTAGRRATGDTSPPRNPMVDGQTTPTGEPVGEDQNEGEGEEETTDEDGDHNRPVGDQGESSENQTATPNS